MATMVSRLLDAAETLLEERPRSAAFRRRAVSTAYYAVFHSLAKSCTAALLPSVPQRADEYVRIYRALEHGVVGAAFKKAPLNEYEAFRKIGLVAERLKTERHNADYLPPSSSLYSKKQVEELIAQARETIAAIEGLNSEECRRLAAFLLFKDRKS